MNIEDDEDFLAAVEADNANETVTEPAPEPVVEAPEVKEELPQPAVEEPPVAQVAPEPEAAPQKAPVMVPIGVLHEVRDELKQVKQKIATYEQAQQPAPNVEIPDMLDDPEGFANYQAVTFQNATLNVKLDMSEELVRQSKGDELVDKARDWALDQFQRRPAFQQEVLGQRNPYGYLVQQYEREQIASTVTADDFAQFTAWKQAQAGLTQQQQAAPAATPTPPAIPPRSLASAPSAGGSVADAVQTDQDIFEEVIPKG